ncbi:hypothetical protein ES703_89229 [subsurface metagenome]
MKYIDDLGIISSAPGSYHRDWEWWYVGLSRDGRYVLADSRDSEEYDFTFLLMDRETKKVLWEKGLYEAEFDEPGDIAISNDGTCFITQDFNLFVVDKKGDLLFKKMYEETGKRYWDVAVTGDGSRFITFLEGWDTDLDCEVEIYDSKGNVLWGVKADQGERSFTVDVSSNGKYFGVYDRTRYPFIEGI